MANDNQPYGIGSDVWPGLAKLMEEMGELQQVLGKIMACEGTDAIYWDGSSLVPQLIEEMGDVRASMIFFGAMNGIPRQAVHDRADMKLGKFKYWDAKTRHDAAHPDHEFLPGGDDSTFGPAGSWCRFWTGVDQCGRVIEVVQEDHCTTCGLEIRRGQPMGNSAVSWVHINERAYWEWVDEAGNREHRAWARVRKAGE